MPKRLRSEDEENFGVLMKNHISEREVNMGVLKDLNMRRVHEKTLALLFRGQKNVANNNAEYMQESAAPSKDKQMYRQLCLTNTGACTNMEPSSSAQVTRELSSCCSCLRTSCLPTGRTCETCSGAVGSTCLRSCSSCGNSCCGSCDGIRQCGGCENLFCGNCALPRGSDLCTCALCM